MRAMYNSNMECQAREYIEKKLIPQVISFKKVSISFSDAVKNGLEMLINIVMELIREYGLCMKMTFGNGSGAYQFWYETE